METEEVGCVIVIMALFVLIVWACFAISKAQNQWEDGCKAKGGVVMSHSSSSVVNTISGNGQIGTGVSTSTTYYCVVDGKVVDIQ